MKSTNRCSTWLLSSIFSQKRISNHKYIILLHLEMTDYAPESQILQMAREEFVKIAENIQRIISWDQGGMCKSCYNYINAKSLVLFWKLY